MDAFAWNIINQQRAWVDQATELRGDNLLVAGIMKLTEEIGEVAAAWAGCTGTNARKGVTHTRQDVADELADVAITALLALTAATGDPHEALTARLAHVYTRSLDHGAPPLPKAEYNPHRPSWLASLPTVLAATVVLLTDGEDRVLLVQQGYREPPRNWALPGGGLNDDEPPRIGARREVLEETSLNIDPGQLLAVTWHPATDRPPLVVFVYDGGVITDKQLGKIRLLDGELTEYGFFTLDEAAPLMAEPAHRELAAALAVRAGLAVTTDLVAGRRS